MIVDGRLRVSVTELQDYMRCHRKWDLTSANRRSLMVRGAPRKELYTGSAFHHGVAAGALGYDPIASLHLWQEQETKALAREFADQAKRGLSPAEIQTLQDGNAMAETILRHYFQRYGTENPISKFGTYICPEVTFRIPMDDGDLVGTVDGVADVEGEVGLVEHKTYSQKPDTSGLGHDHQMVGYSAALAHLIRERVSLALYDGVNKKIPKTMPVLQSGKLSRDKEKLGHVTRESYIAQVVELGQDPEDEYYEAVIDWLTERDDQDQTPFFTRKRVEFNRHQQQMWLENANRVISEMAQLDPADAYPHRAWTGCWDCDVKDLCDAIDDGTDLEDLINRRYKIDTYGTQIAQRSLTPEIVRSRSDLEAQVAKWKQLEDPSEQGFVRKEAA